MPATPPSSISAPVSASAGDSPRQATTGSPRTTWHSWGSPSDRRNPPCCSRRISRRCACRPFLPSTFDKVARHCAPRRDSARVHATCAADSTASWSWLDRRAAAPPSDRIGGGAKFPVWVSLDTFEVPSVRSRRGGPPPDGAEELARSAHAISTARGGGRLARWCNSGTGKTHLAPSSLGLAALPPKSSASPRCASPPPTGARVVDRTPRGPVAHDKRLLARCRSSSSNRTS